MENKHLLAWYRKHRPQSFDDVYGQEHVVRALSQSVKSKNPSHAYLFAGPRGTGKTSMARIFARSLGCSESDVHEIDGASHRGIDEIRALREAVSTLPFNSRYKVYVIDEVHMLTREAFNALLKTLEEPPSHVIFILATTEMEKVPDTITSRTEVFVFKKPTESVLREVLLRVAREEKINLEEGALSLIVFLAEGSFRDAIGMLEQVVRARHDGTVSQDDVEKLFGVPPAQSVKTIISGFLEKKIDEALSALSEARDRNKDIKILTLLMIRYLRAALYLRLAPHESARLEAEWGTQDFQYVKKLSLSPLARTFPNLLRTLMEAYQQMHYVIDESLPLELALAESLMQDSKE